MTRRALLLLLALPAALLALAWFGPRLLDWEAQRDRLAGIVTARLGRPVALGGPLRVTLLPQPMVEASRVLVGAEEGSELGITARALRLRLGLGALLIGRFEPRDLVLVGAEIRLPWPPSGIGALRPPPWLTDFDARIEDSRVSVGGAVLEGVAARLAAPGPLDAVRTEGSFTWRGAQVRFEAVVGRPGFDGVATLDIGLGAPGAHATARGVLVAEGGFEGRIEASGNDLSQIFTTPPGPFRASGRVSVTAELAAADDLALDIGGVTGRGAATFRFAPDPRLDIALALARLDLDAWIAALRGAAQPPLPVGLDLSAEAASFNGVTLRGLRGGVVREGDRLTLSRVSATLPGEAELEANGHAQGLSLELAVQIAGPSLRTSLAGFGLSMDGFEATRLRGFEARGRIVLAPAELSVTDLAGMIDGARIGGAGLLRFGARPAVALGLSIDRLDLDGLLPAPASLGEALRQVPGFDANLRLAVEALAWREHRAGGLTLDASLEQGRLVLRRLAGKVADAEVALSGGLVFGATPRFADLVLEVAAPSAAVLVPLLTPSEGIAALPLRLRVTGGGPAEALAIAAEGEAGELRLAGQGTLAAGQDRLAGNLTLRHPGAPRLMTLLGAAEPPDWLGEGSLSVIAGFAASSDGIATENLELIAGGLRARGQLALALDGPRPRLTGRVAAERLPLPPLPGRGSGPIGLGALGHVDAELAIEAAQLVSPDLPPLEALAARLTLTQGRLALEGLRAGIGGGTIEGRILLDAAAQPPQLSGALGLVGATLSGPLFGTPFDIAAGHVSAEGRFTASGHGTDAMLATFAGDGRLGLASGVLTGVALGAAATAAGLEEAPAAEEGVRAALAGGATAIERLEGGWRASAGAVALEGVRLAAEGGVTGAIEGRIDLARDAIDLRFSVRPTAPEAPAIALRAAGPAAAPRRQPEMAPWARWRAER